jgi:peptidoglycan/xylan/chitin deacetylase (PgdA/CDA1 family)
MKAYTLLSFDVEEFDMPLEYNQAISANEQMEVGKRGLDALIPLWEKYNLTTTLFTTANFAQTFPDAIKALATKHEIASHTFYHSDFKNEHLLQSRVLLEEISGSKVTGLRMPRMRKVEMAEVIRAGYDYDSSINPTFLPGRYNNFHLPRTVYRDDNMVRMPASVSPLARLPLFWLGFKNYPYWLFLKLCEQTFKKDGYLCLYFHPWEFTDISNYNMPSYTKKPNGKILLERLERLINDLSKYSDFTTIQDYLSLKQFINKN